MALEEEAKLAVRCGAFTKKVQKCNIYSRIFFSQIYKYIINHTQRSAVGSRFNVNLNCSFKAYIWGSIVVT